MPLAAASFQHPSVVGTWLSPAEAVLVVSFAGASVASTAKVTCVTANGQQVSAGASYTIRVTASYKCDNRPATAVASATMAVRKPTQASLVRQGAARLSVCTGGGPNSVSVTHKYEVVNEDAVGAADLSVSASASILGITCSAEIRKGASVIHASY